MSASRTEYDSQRSMLARRTRAYRRSMARRSKQRMRKLANLNYMYSDGVFCDGELVERGYVKRYYFGDEKRWYKRYAAHKVRRSEDVAGGSAYKKEFDLWWTLV